MYLIGESYSALSTSFPWTNIFKSLISRSYFCLFEERNSIKSSEANRRIWGSWDWQATLLLHLHSSYLMVYFHHFVLMPVPLSKPSVSKFNSLRWEKLKWSTKRKKKRTIENWVIHPKHLKCLVNNKLERLPSIECRGEERIVRWFGKVMCSKVF